MFKSFFPPKQWARSRPVAFSNFLNGIPRRGRFLPIQWHASNIGLKILKAKFEDVKHLHYIQAGVPQPNHSLYPPYKTLGVSPFHHAVAWCFSASFVYCFVDAMFAGSIPNMSNSMLISSLPVQLSLASHPRGFVAAIRICIWSKSVCFSFCLPPNPHFA